MCNLRKLRATRNRYTIHMHSMAFVLSVLLRHNAALHTSARMHMLFVCFMFYPLLDTDFSSVNVYSNGVRADCAVRHVFRVYFPRRQAILKLIIIVKWCRIRVNVQTNLYGVLIALHFTPQVVLWICFVNREFI